MTASIMTHDGRKAWSFAALMGASMVFTCFAAVAVWLVSKNETYTLYLGLAAHAQLLVCLGALASPTVRRTIKAGKDGIEISDQREDEPKPSLTVTVENKP